MDCVEEVSGQNLFNLQALFVLYPTIGRGKDIRLNAHWMLKYRTESLAKGSLLGCT